MRRTTPSEAEALAVEAKRFHARGEHEKALALLRQSSDALPGRARTELDTAELARRLGQNEVAVRHYRRAAAAYAKSGFARQGLAPLRTALHIEHSRLPLSTTSVSEIARELADALVRQGFAGDAHQVIELSVGAFVERGLPVPEELAALVPPPALAHRLGRRG
jgi:hypothetical protein